MISVSVAESRSQLTLAEPIVSSAWRTLTFQTMYAPASPVTMTVARTRTQRFLSISA